MEGAPIPAGGNLAAKAEEGLGSDIVVEQNCSRIREILSARRCLLILDAPAADGTGRVIAVGRSSFIVTEQPVQRRETPESLDYARTLLSVTRYAEAYELLYRLMNGAIDAETCARELAWICEHWDRIEKPSRCALESAHRLGTVAAILNAPTGV